MSARVLAGLAFKICGIYLIVQVLLSIPLVWTLYGSLSELGVEDGSAPHSPYGVAGVFILIGAVMSAAIYRLGSSVLTQLPSESENIAVFQVERLALQLLGAVFVVHAIDYLPATTIYLFHSEVFEGVGHVVNQIEAVTYGCELVLGLTFISRPHAWLQFFEKWRG